MVDYYVGSQVSLCFLKEDLKMTYTNNQLAHLVPDNTVLPQSTPCTLAKKQLTSAELNAFCINLADFIKKTVLYCATTINYICFTMAYINHWTNHYLNI